MGMFLPNAFGCRGEPGKLTEYDRYGFSLKQGCAAEDGCKPPDQPKPSSPYADEPLVVKMGQEPCGQSKMQKVSTEWREEVYGDKPGNVDIYSLVGPQKCLQQDKVLKGTANDIIMNLANAIHEIAEETDNGLANFGCKLSGRFQTGEEDNFVSRSHADLVSCRA